MHVKLEYHHLIGDLDVLLRDLVHDQRDFIVCEL